ncbi:MAG: hypothetical protein JO142_14765 [Burkholderiales bacterium]|nr:hypothetical protein [Burkholderiales bacterium]
MALARATYAFAVAVLTLAGAAATAQVPVAPVLDPLPHELHPDDWPQPDYFSEALKLTRFQPGERSRALKLAAGLDPDVLVLPVQMEAFGWAPAFTAILGARLDHELATRAIDANRQTDLFDAEGPYVRRFTKAEIAAFAAAHARSKVLALYVGRDAAGKDFVTLTLLRDGHLLRVHRSFVELPQVSAALDAFSANFPAMLDELGLVAGKAKPPTESLRRCDASDWALVDLKPGATRAARACRALVVGTLLPEFEWETTDYSRPKTADKLPWLAEAWVEADALMPDSSSAMRAVAWSQFELTQSYDAVSTAIDVDDPVVRALARGLWARTRTKRMPMASRDVAQEDYAAAASTGLPPFAHAAFTERAAFQQQFRRVDLCSLEMELPALRTPVDCTERQAPARRQPATRAERALLEAWRIAGAYKDLYIEGEARAIPERRRAVLDSMPTRIAAHPLIRMERFRSEHFNEATGSFEALVKRAKAATADFVQTTADVQRWNSILSNNTVRYDDWTSNEALRGDPAIWAVAMDEERLTAVLSLDGFKSREFPPFMRATHANLNLLSAGPLVNPGARQAPPVRPAIVASSPQGANPRPAISRPVFRPDPFANMWIPDWKDQKQIELAVKDDPEDLLALTDLAVLRLKTGQSVVQVRALIDAMPSDKRAGSAIGESHRWASPAHAFFFAGELEAAGFYYSKVARTGTYSSSDLQARVRLRLLAGDIPGALKASQERLDRYQDDFARRDIAGYEFMRGHPDRAWAALAPRLPMSDQSEFWAGVMVGQRMQGMSARSARDWIVKSSYGHARIGGVDILTFHALRFMIDDRVPSADDIALLAELRAQQPDGPPPGAIADLQALALLKQLATAPRVAPEDVQAVRDLLVDPSDWRTRSALKPLYAWAAWQASGGKDSSLTSLRAAKLTQDFDSLLAKGVLLGLDKQHDEALRYLRAARYDLVNTIGSLRRDARSAPYSAAFVAWLLYGQTHDARYRDEALLLARAHERTFPFLAWPYALDASLSPDGPARTTAACRAAFLDRGSLFLSASGLRPDPHGKSCRNALW